MPIYKDDVLTDQNVGLPFMPIYGEYSLPSTTGHWLYFLLNFQRVRHTDSVGRSILNIELSQQHLWFHEAVTM